jgi:hypothetical protein
MCVLKLKKTDEKLPYLQIEKEAREVYHYLKLKKSSTN